MNFIAIFVIKYVMLFFSLTGNCLGITALMRKKMQKIASREIYMLILALDSIYLVTQMIDDTTSEYGIKLGLTSNLICKLRLFWNFAFASITPWLLVYALLERLLKIIYTTVRFYKKNHTQKMAIFIITTITIAAYSPFLICVSIYEVADTFSNISMFANQTQSYKECWFENDSISETMLLFDLIYKTQLPSIFMFSISITLIAFIFYKRHKSNSVAFSYQKKKRLTKDIRLSITCIVLNLVFLFTYLPLDITNYLWIGSIDELGYQITIVIFYMSFTINFYVLFLTNSFFRDEVLCMLNIKKK